MIEEKMEKEKRMFSWMNPKLEVRDVGKYEGGIRQKIEKGRKSQKRVDINKL